MLPKSATILIQTVGLHVRKRKNMKGVNLTYYREKDWNRFLESIDDRDSMHDTWKEWHKAYQKTKKDLIAKGFIVKDFIVEINELINYCKIRKINNDGKARSKFAVNR